jgi:hypothetical protein
LTHSPRKRSKRQNISLQQSASPKGRIRVIDMPSSPRINPSSTGQ